MDSNRFDRLAQWVGAGNRRQVLGTVLVGAAALVVGADSAYPRAKRKVKAEGPCGDRSIKDNRCKRNGQCCTGYCDK